MSAEEKNPESILDRIVENIRNEPVDPQAVSAAADRAWQRIRREAEAAPAEPQTIRTCADYQALIPAWREKHLSPARALLFKDHVNECPACRKAVWGVKEQPHKASRPPMAPVWRWAMAATVLVGLAASTWLMLDRFMPVAGRATVNAIEGMLLQAGAAGSLPVGAEISDGEAVRTAKGSGAVVRMRDGSLIELAERTELSMTERRDGATIRLTRGNIIVRAAKQRSRRLYVATADCRVSVKGTIFSVNHGMRGSRVAVIEGEVQVAQGDQTKILRAGEQVSTSDTLTPVSVEREIAWSRNFDEYLGLLKEFSALRQKLEAMPGPGLRYESRLLPLVPPGVVFYAALPNLGQTLDNANRIFQEQLAQSSVLRQWWTDKMAKSGGEAKLNEGLDKIRLFSSWLGPEVVIAVAPGADGRDQTPIVLAEVTRSGFREFLQQEMQKAGAHQVRIVDDPFRASPAANKDEFLVYLAPNNVAAASNDVAALRGVAAAISGAAPSPFVSTDFYARIAAAYRSGVAWLFCADLQPVLAKEHSGKPENLQASGFGDLRYAIVERKDIAGQTENRALITFAQPRRSVASWLAAPAAMRVLDYVSPDATFATAFVVKNPGQLVEELFRLLEASDPGFANKLADFESKTGVNVRMDLAQPLGGEFAVAMDGPVLPVPSWKLVLEVYDQGRFQHAVESLVNAANREMASHSANAQPVRLASEQVGSRIFYSLRGLKAGLEAHYIYDDRLLIAAANRDLVLRALDAQSKGYSLPQSAKFAALLPQDGRTSFSGMVYHSLGSLAGIAGKFLTPEQQKQLAGLAASATPTLVLAYGGSDSIQIASRGSFFGIGIEQFFGLKPPGNRGAGPAPAKPRRPPARQTADGDGLRFLQKG